MVARHHHRGLLSSILVFTGSALLLLSCGTSAVEVPVLNDTQGNVVYTNGTIDWGSIPGDSLAYQTVTEYNEDGLSILFKSARSFLDTIQPGAIPYDIIRDVLDGKFNVGDRYKELIDVVLGFAICFALGLIFVILMPLAGCCFCCCRCCCNNCGGDRIAKKRPNDACKRMGLAQALFIMCLCMGAAAACCYVANDRFSNSLQYVNTTVGNNFDDIEIYTNNTVDQFLYLAVDMYAIVNRAVVRDMDYLGTLLGEPVRDSMLPLVNPAITSLIALDSTITNTLSGLSDVLIAVAAVQAEGDTLTSFLNDLAANITTTQSSCSASCTPTTACDAIDPSTITMGADYNLLPDLNDTYSSVQGIASQNLTAMVLQGRNTLYDIPEMLNNETVTYRADVKTQLDDYAVQIQTMVDSFIQQVVGAINVATFKSDVDTYIELAIKYDQYRWYGGIGLMSVYILIVLCMVLGIFCGCCGSKKGELPIDRGGVANCGGNCLLLAVVVMFLVASLLMLLTMIAFSIGGLTEKFCESLIDLTLFRDFIDDGGLNNFNFAEMLLNNASIPLTVYNVLLGCRDNQAPFRLMYFDTLIPLDDYLNYQKYLGSLDSMFDTMSDAVALDGIDILNDETIQTLDDFKNSGVTAINYTYFQDILSASTLDFDTSTMVSALQNAASLCTSPVSDELNFHADQVQYIEDTLIPNLEVKKMALNTTLLGLQSITDNIVTSVDDAIEAANITEVSVKNQALDIIMNDTRTYVDRILYYVEQYKVRALDIVGTELAACRPVWNLYDSSVLIVCYYMIDALNSFWFAMGWGLLFFIPAIVVGVKLSKFYLRMKELGEGYEDVNLDEEGGDEYYNGGYDDYYDETKKKGGKSASKA